jgi:hypothetical protein
VDILNYIRSGWPGEHDLYVNAAHRLLQRLEPHECPPLPTIWVTRSLEEGVDGKCVRDWIFISPRSAFYQRHHLTELAMLVHHEHLHGRYPKATEREILRDRCGLPRAMATRA